MGLAIYGGSTWTSESCCFLTWVPPTNRARIIILMEGPSFFVGALTTIMDGMSPDLGGVYLFRIYLGDQQISVGSLRFTCMSLLDLDISVYMCVCIYMCVISPCAGCIFSFFFHLLPFTFRCWLPVRSDRNFILSAFIPRPISKEQKYTAPPLLPTAPGAAMLPNVSRPS